MIMWYIKLHSYPQIFFLLQLFCAHSVNEWYRPRHRPVHPLSNPRIKSTHLGGSMASSASLSLSGWFLSASSSCLSWTCSTLTHLHVCCLLGKSSRDRNTQTWLALVFIYIYVYVCAYICAFPYFFKCQSSYTREGWNGVTARITHSIY